MKKVYILFLGILLSGYVMAGQVSAPPARVQKLKTGETIDQFAENIKQSTGTNAAALDAEIAATDADFVIDRSSLTDIHDNYARKNSSPTWTGQPTFTNKVFVSSDIENSSAGSYLELRGDAGVRFWDGAVTPVWINTSGLNMATSLDMNNNRILEIDWANSDHDEYKQDFLSTTTWKAADSNLLDNEDSTHFVDTTTAQDIGGQKTFDDEVRISSGFYVNTNYFVVGSTGNVGIGILNPVARLHINGGNFYVVNTNAFFAFGDALTSGNYGFIRWNSASDYFEIGADDDPSPVRNVVMQADNKGNVGISTTIPNTRFVVNDGSVTISGNDANLIVGGIIEASTMTNTSGQGYVYFATHTKTNGNGNFTGEVTASTFNTTGSAYQINGINIINGDGSIHAYTGNAAALIVGTGAANVYYKIQFIGTTSTGTIEWEYDHGAKGRFNLDCGMLIDDINIADHLHTDELLIHTTDIFGITIGSNTYIVGYASATKFYGDISDCTGGAEAAEFISETDFGVEISSNLSVSGVIVSSAIKGFIYTQNSSSITAISGIGVYTKILGTSTVPSALNFWFDGSNNGLTYLCPITGYATIQSEVVFTAATKDIRIGIALYKNGVYIPGSKVSVNTNGIGTYNKTSAFGRTFLNAGDKVEIYIVNYNETTDLTATDMAMSIDVDILK